jgi:hypothetical protein
MCCICCQQVAQKQACSRDADHASVFIGSNVSFESVAPQVEAAEHLDAESMVGDQVVPVGA